MTNHYYNSNLETQSQEKSFKFKLLSHELTFYTDYGVFSKNIIDYGTWLLINNCRLEPWYKNVLDVGCGYGPIGISLAKEYETIHFDLIDINLRALNLTKKNTEINNLRNISIFESNIYEMIHTNYDCIITNPPIRAGKKIVHQILEDAIKFLNKSGAIYIVIQKKQGASSAIAKLEEVFGNCEVICHNKGYFILKSVKK